MSGLDVALLVAVAAWPSRSRSCCCGGDRPSGFRCRRRPPDPRPLHGEPRPDRAQAAIRIARAEEAVLVPAYLLIVPLRTGGLAAARPGQAGDARARGGRARGAAGGRTGGRPDREGPHATQPAAPVGGRAFDRIVAPAPADGRGGFTEKELAWLLLNAPTETLVLRPRRPGRGTACTPPPELYGGA